MDSESNGIKLEKKDQAESSGFQIIVETKSEKCPKAASFLSFDSVLQKITHPAPPKSNFLQVSSAEEPGEENANDQGEDNKSAPVPNTTPDAIDYVSKALNERKVHFNEYLKFIEDIETLVKENTVKLRGIEESDISPKKQAKQIDGLKDQVGDVRGSISKLVKNIYILYDEALERLQSAIDQNQIAKKFQPFREKFKYTQNIHTLYSPVDSSKIAKKSDWQYTTTGVEPKENAILQPTAMGCNADREHPKDACTATALDIKYKNFFDFTFKFSFKVIEMGNWIGVQFRKQSIFTFYALDIFEDFLRFRIMHDGNQKIIGLHKFEKKLFTNIWYNVELTARRSILTVKLNQDMTGSVKESIVNVEFTTDNGALKSGFFAL